MSIMLKQRKLYTSFVNLENAFDIALRIVLEWPTRKKGIPKVVVRSVMSLFEGAKIRVKVDSELSEEFEVKVGIHKESVLLPFLFAVVVDFVTEFAIVGVLCQLLCAEYLVLMCKMIKGLRNKFLKWMEAGESMDLNVNLGIT